MALTLHAADRDAYEKLVSKSSFTNLWQSLAWGDFQEKIGRKVHRFFAQESGRTVAAFQVIEHPLPFKFSYWYLPRGPVFFHNILETGVLIGELSMAARKKRVVFLKADGVDASFVPANLKVRKTWSPQPEHSLVIDLTLSEQDILARMKQKGRYNVRLAQKKNVTTRFFDHSSPDLAKHVGEFYSLLQKTTERDAFRGHGLSYYESMLSTLGSHAVLIMAYLGEKPVAGGIFTFYGEEAVYYYGASSDEDRNCMAPYLVQWEAIREAKKRGCKRYDFLGIAPAGVKNHPWSGVTEFKLKFGGEQTKACAAFDVPLRRIAYFFYRLRRR